MGQTVGVDSRATKNDQLTSGLPAGPCGLSLVLRGLNSWAAIAGTPIDPASRLRHGRMEGLRREGKAFP